MRTIKSPREIAVIREATRITGLAIMEAMRDARPGMYEYELQADAEFVFKKHGAYGPSYFALIATGTEQPVLALSPQHGAARRRRPGAVRLRAGLQVLPVGRHARLPRQRPLHTAPARVLHDLPAALSGADDLHQGPDRAARDHQERRRQDGRRSSPRHVHGRQDQGCGDRVRGALPHEHAPTASATRSAWRCTTSAARRRRSNRG